MKTTWYKSNPIELHFEDAQIDAEAGILRDVVMCQVGPAKGHGVHIEQSFIEGLVEYATKHYGTGPGLKARFGHPALSDTTMGSQMGYFRNIRLREDQAIGDLHLLNSAELSPKAPQMRSWVLSMAEEATDFMMSSIVFKPSGLYQYDPESGERVDLEGSAKFAEEPVFVDFNEEAGASLMYTDLVESGAATASLFSTEVNRDLFAVRTIEFLEENEDILAFIRSNPHKLIEMAEKLGIELPQAKPTPQDKFSALKAWIFGEKPEETAAEAPENRAAEELAGLHVKYATLAENYELLQLEAADDRAKLAAELAKKDERIKELEEKHLAAPAALPTEPPAAPDAEYDAIICETTLKAMRNGKH